MKDIKDILDIEEKYKKLLMEKLNSDRKSVV